MLSSLLLVQDAKFMEGVKNVAQLRLQPRQAEIQRKCQIMSEWNRSVIIAVIVDFALKWVAFGIYIAKHYFSPIATWNQGLPNL